MIRPIPPHEPAEETRPKCSLRGDYAQMGPRARGTEDPMVSASQFWADAAPRAKCHSERLRPRDRFCAISLIKRFAWACYLHEATGFKNAPDRMNIADTATIAAMDWLRQVGGDGNSIRTRFPDWSGHWLHWKEQHPSDKEDEEDPPDKTWNFIKELRGQAKDKDLPSRPPAYYAILVLDGDHMGERFRRANRKQHPKMSGDLADFALNTIPKIVKNHLGTLVYAGGDDVLALLPTATALACAKEVHDALASLPIPIGGPITSSAGIAVAHYKFNLQDAITAARRAEEAAKDAGRDRFALTILRRSGEHTTAVAPWSCVIDLNQLVNEFRAGKSDRWAYQLRASCAAMLDEAGTAASDEAGASDPGDLAASLCSIVDLEARRLIRRKDAGQVPENAESTWVKLIGTLVTPVHNGHAMSPLKARETALTLIQSASFLARAKEEN